MFSRIYDRFATNCRSVFFDKSLQFFLNRPFSSGNTVNTEFCLSPKDITHIKPFFETCFCRESNVDENELFSYGIIYCVWKPCTISVRMMAMFSEFFTFSRFSAHKTWSNTPHVIYIRDQRQKLSRIGI